MLLKRPPDDDVSENDIFLFNADFQDPATRIHINPVSSKDAVSGKSNLETAILIRI